jgi:putative DNA primase/helicase
MHNDIDRVRDALRFVPVGGHDERVRVAFMLKSELGEEGRELWDEWRGDRGNDESDAVWRSADAWGSLRIGTLFHLAKQNGWSNSQTFIAPTPDEIRERDRIAREVAARNEQEIAQEREETAKKASAVLAKARNVEPDNPYLLAKGVSPVSTLREITAGEAARILGYTPKSNDEILEGRLLVVPVKQGCVISTVELIDGSKRKAALAGRGTKAGGFWATERLPEGDGENLTLLIGEGVATVLSCSEATKHIGVAALSAGNLLAVTEELRGRYPSAELVILSDLVKATGGPDPRAIEASKRSSAKLAIPDFGEPRDQAMTDFNDMASVRGINAVKSAIEAAKKGLEYPDTQNPRAVVLKGWETPQPLVAELTPEPYPLDALPETIREAVEEVAGFVKAPIPLVASSALAAVSLAIQAHIDVRREEKLEGPTGLFFLTIADSGERKSSCDGYFSRAIREYEAAKAEEAKPLLTNYRSDLAAWEAKQGGLKDKIRQLSKDSKSTGSLEDDLRRLEREKPEQPRFPRLVYADVTPEALAYELSKKWPSAGLMSAEAGLVLGSHGMGKDSVMRNLALMNQLWDGSPLSVDRRSSDSFTVQGARLTVALQIQEPTLKSFFDRSGELARGTGFLARFLVAWPESTQGTRLFSSAPKSWPALERFDKRLGVILSSSFSLTETGGLSPVMLNFSPEAKKAWIDFHDTVETELASGGDLYDIRDVASKSSDNAARLAALFQFFEGGLGAIDIDPIRRASRIVAWHLSESRRFFGELALPQELADSIRLNNWLINRARQTGTLDSSTRDAQRAGPIRVKLRLNLALDELVNLGRIRLLQEGKKRLILVNPYLVGDGK